MIRWLPLGLCLVACTSPEPQEDTCEPVVAGDTFTGPNGSVIEIVMTNPAPPARFTNWWAVRVDDPDGADMIDPARLVVSAYMPEHGHSAPVTPEVTAEVDGLVVGPLELWMPGRWEIRFDVDRERVIVPLCIEE
jgi:hypothetical protein